MIILSLWREMTFIFSSKHMPGGMLGNLLTFLLVLIFSVLYLPQAFVMFQDINLISAFEVDPGSMIASINDLFQTPIYNMMNGYHSKFYGWT